jgi:hypothetical protein
MPKATPTITTPETRADVHGPTLPASNVASAGTDADLLEACEEFFAADARVRTGHRTDTEVNATLDAWLPPLKRVTSLQATTAAGKAAKARVALLALESVQPSEAQPEEKCALSALRDLVAEANGCVVPVEAYEALERGARLLRDRAERLNRGLKGIASQERPA